jgi:DNA-binding SARP family transcriptional activator
MLASIRIYLFGGFRLTMSERDLPPIATLRARSLFAYLAMHPRRAHTRDLLAGHFWPDLPDAAARRRLSQALWHIRRAFRAAGAPCSLIVDANAIQFDSDAPYWLDVEAFERAGGRPGVRSNIRTGQEAVALYRGDFMEGFYDDWIIPERERLRDLYLGALGNWVMQCKEAGEYEEALRFAHQVAIVEPLRENAHCEIIRLCRLLDRPQEALQQYEILKDVLATELGIEPSQTATRLHRQLLAGDEKTFPAPVGSRSRTSPFLDSSFSIPLVGRKTERANLLAGLDAAMRGNGGIALVGGEAGVGKTRLLQEIARDAEWRGMQVLWGWGRERSSVPPYDTLGQILQTGLTPLRVEQLTPLLDSAWLSALEAVLPNQNDLWPDLPPSAPLKPEQQQRRVHEAITQVALSLGEINPHLLIVEDVHWAPDTDLAALHHLAQRLATSHVFIIISYRSAEVRERPTAWRILQQLHELGRHERLELNRLTDMETQDLVRLGLGLQQAAPRFTRRVHLETGGNPLFVLEMLRSLYNEGILYRDESGAWNTPWDATTTDYAELPTPPGVHQVIARRLARLNSAERATINAAAILGERFDFTLLSRLLEQDGPTCVKSIRTLISRRFLEEEPNALRFSHNLVRQVVITEMDASEKRRRHAAVVARLADMQPAQIETLAYHATQGELWEQALAYNQQAGSRARSIYAGDKAIEFYTRALDAWLHLGDDANHENLALLQSRGETFQETGQFDLAEQDFRAVIRLAAQAQNRQAQAAASNSLSYLHFQRGAYDLALEISTQAYDMASQIKSEAHMARALLNSANALRNLGRSSDSIGFYRRATAALEAIDDEVRLADCLNRMGYAYFFDGQLAEAEAAMLRGLAMRRRLDEKVGLAYSLSNLSGLYFYKGDFAHAKETAEEAYAVAIAAGDPYGQDAALQSLGTVYLAQGSLNEAIGYLERALAIAREIGDNPLVAEALADVGLAYAKKGDFWTASALQLESLHCSDEGGEIWYLCKTREYLAETNLALGNGDVAYDQARQALDLANELAAPHLLGTAHRVMATVLANLLAQNAITADVEPVQHFEQSLHYLQEGGFRASLARTLAAYGRYLLADGRDEQRRRGTAMVERARALFQEMGMAWDLAQLARGDAVFSQPHQLSVRLPLVVAPTGRPLRDDEWVDVVWNIAAVEDENIPGKTARRQHRLLRLLREAEEQNAAPRVTDLARALDVSPKTIKRDLAALRAAGHHARTRGSRGVRPGAPTKRRL